MKKPKLVSPDKKRCQGERRVGAFQLGPPQQWRCEKKPVAIVYENVPSPDDGLKGSMSLCQECLTAFKSRYMYQNENFTIKHLGIRGQCKQAVMIDAEQ